MRTQFYLDRLASSSWWKIALAVGLIVVFDAATQTAPAKSRHSHRSEPEKRRQPQPEEPAPPAGPLFVVISTGKQKISVYGRDGLYARGPVSTGQPDHPTPLGVFTILAKELYHESNIYSGAPMPFMQRITFSGVAMHEGVLPGYPASHGCIRMPHEFAKRMFDYTQGNERVIISRADVVPANISHPALPLPKFQPLTGNADLTSGSAQILRNSIATASGATKVDLAIKGSESERSPDPAAGHLLNPIEFAQSMQDKAAKTAEQTAAAVRRMQSAADVKVRLAKAAALELRKSEIAVANARSRLEFAERILQRASGEKSLEEATIAKTTAQAKLKDAGEALEAAKRTKSTRDEESAASLAALREADHGERAAAAAVKSWNRKLAPLSIFISRKAQRLYVYQAYTKVFDVPIAIRDPQKPIGTHLYFAMPPSQDGPQANLRWLVLTLPEGTSDDDYGSHRRRRNRYADDDDAPRIAEPSASASEALNRIEVPTDVTNTISEMLWAGSSLIIADSDVSKETTDYAGSDLTVLMR